MKYKQIIVNVPVCEVRESSGTRIHTPEQFAKRMSHTEGLAQETFNIITLDTNNSEIDANTSHDPHGD